MYDEQVLNVICDMKYCSDVYGKEILDDYPDIDLGEETEWSFYEELYQSEYFISGKYYDGISEAKMFFSSEYMTEYYKLAKKIGHLYGWKERENIYISNGRHTTLNFLNKMDSCNACCGVVHTGTRHKYASSLTVYIYEEEFYNYMELYFVINAIFRFFEKEAEKLKKIYISMLSVQNSEVAA